jgi:hypothetical protein
MPFGCRSVYRQECVYRNIWALPPIFPAPLDRRGRQQIAQQFAQIVAQPAPQRGAEAGFGAVNHIEGQMMRYR